MEALPLNASLADLQVYAAAMVVERGFDKQTIHEQFMKFLEECGELAKAAKHVTKHPGEETLRKEAGHECVDVLLYLLHIANMLKVDLTTAWQEKEAINNTRTWA